LGVTATEKALPAACFRLGTDQVALLVARLWEGDGHVDVASSSAFYATSSPRLAKQVSHLLLRLGIIGRTRRVEFPYRGSVREGWQVFVTGAENLSAFRACVAQHFVTERYREAVAALRVEADALSASKDVVPVRPVRALARAAKARQGVTWAAVESAADVSTRDLTPAGTSAHKIGFRRQFVRQLGDYFQDAALARLADNDVLWDQIVSIEPLGDMRTFDLEVEGTHNFVANDVIVHNSHSVAYSVLAYHTAWLKAHHPAEFMAALLSSQIGKTDEVIKYVAEAREMGLEVVQPDVNESDWRFVVVGDKRIRFGLGAVRNVGQGAVDSLLAARAERPFTSVWDLAARVDLRLFNKRVFESLIAAGALDSLGMHRAQLMAALDQAIGEATLAQGERETGQGSLFGGLDDDAPAAASPAQHTPPNVPDWSEHERLQREKEILGFYISGHPLDPFRVERELFATHTVAQLGDWTSEAVLIGVVVTAIKRQLSKRSGAEFARLTVEDFSGSSEVLVFPEAWAAIADRVKPDIPLLIRGGYSQRDEGVENATFIVESVQRFAELRAAGELAVVVELQKDPRVDPSLFADVRAALDAHPGSAPFEVHWKDGGGSTRFRSRSLKLAATPLALSDLRALLGDEQVRLVRAS
nr:hypothetical protein [Gemmatimonadaceae bacterium]